MNRERSVMYRGQLDKLVIGYEPPSRLFGTNEEHVSVCVVQRIGERKQTTW